MKKFLLALSLSCLFSTITAQTLYSDELTGNDGMRLVVHEDYLYIGYGGSIFIDRLNLGTMETIPERVASTGTGFPSFAFDYFPAHNSLFIADFGGDILEADLDFPFPVPGALRNNTPFTFAHAQIRDNTLFISGFQPNIWTMDLTDPTYTLNTFFTSASSSIVGPTAIWDGYMYFSEHNTSTDVGRLRRIDLSTSPFEEEIVTPSLGG